MFNIDFKSDSAKLVAAFLAVYLIWGSTYLAIRFGLESLPPFLMSGSRYLIAGALIYLYAWKKGAGHPSRAQWLRATIIGVLLFVLGNGGIVLAAQSIPSGLVSLMVATVPIYVVLLDWWKGGKAPSHFTGAGLAVGVLGMVLLLGPSKIGGATSVDPVGIVWAMLASLAWAVGSLYARHADLPKSQLQSAGMQTVTAGAIMMLISAGIGETSGFNIAEVSTKSWLSLLYLIVFGSIVGFTAYVYMLKSASPTRVSTYAYVNPVVAVFLGWALAGEAVTSQTIMASGVILCAVWLITRPSKPKLQAIAVPSRRAEANCKS
ncbi:MAG: drug/metabolite exporter YedA [Candidatus Obscuribacterales bacterium]|jgi:drug/metabolite transporter (DMT)-like permease